MALTKAVDERVKIEDELDAIRSKSKKERGLFEDEIRQKLDSAIGNERKAQKDLDETVYDILGLKPSERNQIKYSLLELQEIRRLRTQV